MDKVFEELIKVQELLWKDDDLMCQETLFELQGVVAELLLDVATKHIFYGQFMLIKKFPYLYKEEEK